MTNSPRGRAGTTARRRFYEKLFELSPIPHILTDAKRFILKANIEAGTLFGYPAGDLIGQSFETLISSNALGKYVEHVKGLTSDSAKPLLDLELQSRRNDGTEFPVRISLRSIEAADGLALLHTVIERTQLKAAEDALLLSEARFQQTMESLRDCAIFTLSPGGIVTSWNAGAELVLSWKASEIIGKHLTEFCTAADIRDGKPEYELKMAETDGLYDSEAFRVRKDGSIFWAQVLISAHRDMTSRPLGFGMIVRNLTDLKMTDEILSRSEKELRALFEFSPDALIITDQAGLIRKVNSRTEKLFSYSRSELLGNPVEILIPEALRSAHSRHREHYHQKPNARPMGMGFELFGRRKDGSEFPADIMLGPVDMGSGKVVLGVVRDLSEQRAVEETLRRSEHEKQYLEEELYTQGTFDEIIGGGLGLKKVLNLVRTVAVTDTTVLILGETGTGKELIARAIHKLSPRRNKSLIKMDCAAIPAGLLESELFGHEKGSFTGAINQKIGRMEVANEGTLFLDEIGDMPLELQSKILRTIQEREIQRVGSTRTIHIDVRVVAATNRDLEKMVAEGEFRRDLYYRLKVFPIVIPPLRERREDIPMLVRFFAEKSARRLNRKIESIHPAAMNALVSWDWPGNVRELEHFIERAVILNDGPILQVLPSEIGFTKKAPPPHSSTLKANERSHILRALRDAKGKIGGPKGAAAILGLNRTTLNSKLKKLGIQPAEFSD